MQKKPRTWNWGLIRVYIEFGLVAKLRPEPRISYLGRVCTREIIMRIPQESWFLEPSQGRPWATPASRLQFTRTIPFLSSWAVADDGKKAKKAGSGTVYDRTGSYKGCCYNDSCKQDASSFSSKVLRLRALAEVREGFYNGS